MFACFSPFNSEAKTGGGGGRERGRREGISSNHAHTLPFITDQMIIT